MAGDRNQRKPKTVTQHSLFAWHKYFLRSNKMRWHFAETWNQLPKFEKDSPIRLQEEFYAQMYFDYWVASLNVLVEGYEKLGLHDERVDALLDPSMRSVLRKYRGGIYHFREKYWDDDVLLLFRNKNAVQWCHTLNAALGKYMEKEMRKLMDDDTFNPTESLIFR